MPEHISLAVAAAQLQTTPLNVLMHVKRGLLRGTEELDGWQIETASLQELQQRRLEQGTVPVCRKGCGAAGGCGSACG